MPFITFSFSFASLYQILALSPSFHPPRLLPLPPPPTPTPPPPPPPPLFLSLQQSYRSIEFVATSPAASHTAYTQLQGQDTEAGYRYKVQGRDTGAGYRDKVQGQGRGARYRGKLQGQGTGANYRGKVQGQITGTLTVDRDERLMIGVLGMRGWDCI